MSPIIEKIKKLLALSKSDNANEAAVAAGLAARLMAEHQIAAAELGGDSEEKAQKEIDPLVTCGHSMPSWLGVLSKGVCVQNSVYSWTQRDEARNKCVKIIGRPSDVANVRFLFAYLRSEIERLAQKAARGKDRTFAESYRMGAVCGALAAMRKATEEVRAASTGAALLRIDGRLAAARALAPAGLRKMPPVGVGDAAAFASGKTAGGHLHGSSQIAGNGTRLLGAG